MAAGYPVKVDYANGDVLTATNLNDLAGTVNFAVSPTPTTGTQMAGKNAIINGDFNINQRAFTSATALNTFLFDRFLLKATDGTTTATAQTFTAGAAPASGYEAKNFLQVASTGQTLTTARSAVGQPIESVRTFAGQTVTVSFWAKASSGTPSIAVSYDQFFGSGGSPSATVSANITKTAITTSWVRYSASFAVPSISGKTIGTTGNDFLQILIWSSAGSTYNTETNSLGIQTTTIQIWGVQLEAGSDATPFQTATGTIQGELAACQRYYYRTTVRNGSRLGSGFNTSTLAGQWTFPFPTEMRTAPTALEQSGTAADYAVLHGNFTVTNLSAVPTFAFGTTASGTCLGSVASGLTAGDGSMLYANNATGYLGWSAEL